MMPSAIYETLANDTALTGLLGDGDRIFELQSLEERPINTGYFVVVDFQETAMGLPSRLGEQIMTIWAHTPLDVDREYNTINAILNRIDALLLPIIHTIGEDGIRVSTVRQHGRSRNTIDPGWDTTTRNALYGVLFDQSAA